MYFFYFVKDGQLYYFKKINKNGNVIELSKRLTKRVQRYDSRLDAVIARRELEIVRPEFDFSIGSW